MEGVLYSYANNIGIMNWIKVSFKIFARIQVVASRELNLEREREKKFETIIIYFNQKT